MTHTARRMADWSCNVCCVYQACTPVQNVAAPLQHFVVCFIAVLLQLTELDRPSRMMQMFANRVNSRWVEGEGWEVPRPFEVATFSAQVGGAQAQAFKAEALQCLKQGKLAVQVRRGGGAC